MDEKHELRDGIDYEDVLKGKDGIDTKKGELKGIDEID